MAEFLCDSPADQIRWPCDICGETFGSITAKRKHHLRDHSNRGTLARHRPLKRGHVPCGQPGCEATFASATAAGQHRRAKHGL